MVTPLRRLLYAAGALAAGVAAAFSVAQAAFPGANGKIAFARSGDIYLVEPDGSNVEPLVNDALNYVAPAMSPDGETVAFAGGGDIYTIRTDGTGRRNLTDADENDNFDPAWSPDGTKIVFTTSGIEGGTDIATMNADGSARNRLTNTDGEEHVDPEWSPDGETIAFQRNPFAGSRRIETLDIASEQQTGDSIPGEYPSWSPDGSEIAYASDTNIVRRPFPLDIDDSSTPVTDNTNNADVSDTEPSFSPDGNRVVFTSFRGSCRFCEIVAAGTSGIEVALFTAEVGEGADPSPRRLTTPDGRFDGAPDWGRRPPPPSTTTTPPTSTTPTPTTPTTTTPGGEEEPDTDLPPPRRGRTANVFPIDGEVFVKLRGAADPPARSCVRRGATAAGGAPGGFFRLTEARQIPVGAVIDTREGKVELELARNASGSITQTAVISQGLFRFTQATTRALTTLTLRGKLRRERRGRRGRRGSDRTVTTTRHRRSRRLFTRSRGRFRTRTRRSSATVRGTEWLTEERSNGTLTKVKRGTVVVRDFGEGRRVVLGTGDRYFARARVCSRQPSFTG